MHRSLKLWLINPEADRDELSVPKRPWDSVRYCRPPHSDPKTRGLDAWGFWVSLTYTIPSAAIREDPLSLHLLPYYSKSHQFYKQRHSKKKYPHSLPGRYQNGYEATCCYGIQHSIKGRVKSLTANWKWRKLRNKHDVGFLYCFVISSFFFFTAAHRVDLWHIQCPRARY